MKINRSLIISTVLSLAVLYGLGANLSYFLTMLNQYPPEKTDDVVRWEEDMEALKQVIPQDEAVIGYVSDWDRVGYDNDVYIEFTLTVYAFAPQRVERSLDHEWVIANSTEEDEFFAWLTPQLTEPYTVESFGKGIYLIHQEGK